MTRMRLNPPVHWESWCSWLLAIWLCISPGPLKYGDDQIATYAAVLTGFVLVCTEIVTISTFRLWEEWINVFIGCWLIAAPWILHFTSSLATINFVIVGVLVAILALYELWRGAIEKQPKHG
jgi:SPW repeat-containing protein